MLVPFLRQLLGDQKEMLFCGFYEIGRCECLVVSRLGGMFYSLQKIIAVFHSKDSAYEEFGGVDYVAVPVSHLCLISSGGDSIC